MAENLQSPIAVIGDGSDTLRAELYCPDVQFEELYSRIALVREAVGYKDGKAVADCEPIGGYQEVARRLQVGALATEADLINFWHVNFRSPAYADNVKGVTSASSGLPLGTYLTEMWPRLTYHEKKDRGTLLATPNPRLKPGERFAEGYYWDTADGLEGLMVEADQSSDNWRQVFGELRNFAATIKRFGFIPNGMRSYYLSRSQPPRFAHMVKRVAETYDGGMQADKIIAEFLPAVEAEYGWWMKGAGRLSDKDGVRAADHTVLMPGGEILNRYFDTKETPRTESYREDVITAVRLPRDKAPVVYRNIRATAESGRDMNGEAMDDPERLETAAAERLVPVELNSLLWEYEDFMSRAYSSSGALEQAARYRELAEARAAAINKYCYTGDDKTGYYCGFKFMDLNFDYGTPSGYVAMTMAVPVSRGIAPAGRAESVCRKLTQELLQTGGFVASVRETGQQWDWPNGWAPDQDEGVNALVRTAELTGNEVWRMWADAAKIRWLNHHAAIYRSVGKIAEKCNVCVSNPLDVQHGEYPLQYGFLWTNGIMRKFLASEIHGPAQWLIGDVPRP